MREQVLVPEAELVVTAKKLRRHILDALTKAGSGHPGGSFSALEIILTLYSGEMRFDPQEPGAKKRVNRGGSYLCSDQYCSRYVLGSRGKGDVDTGTSNLGFRCVRAVAAPPGAAGH